MNKSAVVESIKSFEDDLRACHEYYCKYNCGLTLPVGNHTPRCDKLRSVWGFQSYSREDVKKGDKK